MQRRFYLMALYSVAEVVKMHRVRRVDEEIVKGIVDSGVILEDSKRITENWRQWVYWGHKYHNLTVDLGGKGILFLIPDDCFSSNYLERKMALQGPGFDSVCQQLVDFGLSTKARTDGLNQVANRIWHWIWDGLERNLSSTYPLAASGLSSTCSTGAD